MRRLLLLLVILLLVGTACSGDDPELTIYSGRSESLVAPLIEQFEADTGIEVLAVYDTEATKTTGLVSRLVAEQDRPQADVFWSSEIAQTLWLADRGIFTEYASPAADDIPTEFKDGESRWIGFGYRARILLVNTDLVDRIDFPTSIFDLVSGSTPGSEMAVANPLFGTTATHVAALYATVGTGEAKGFIEALAENGVRVVDGNSVVRDMVAAGEILFGMTDTDDALIAVEDGAPVEIIFPDQDGLGTLLIPNTVGLVSGGPNPDNGRALIDYLVSRQLEDTLVEAGFFFGSLRDIAAESVQAMEVSWAEVARQNEIAKEDVQSILLR